MMTHPYFESPKQAQSRDLLADTLAHIRYCDRQRQLLSGKRVLSAQAREPIDLTV